VKSTPDLPDGATWRAWGINPGWSRVLDVANHDGDTHRWHVLDTGMPDSDDPNAVTIVCVHGNPTWGYAWKTFLAKFAGRHRVIAIDQLGMGYSERTGMRRYEDRVGDLGDLIDALDLGEAPIVLAAHDWGGAIAMGWAVGHTDRLAGMVLCNTGIGVPQGRGAPKIIRLAASAALRDVVCRRTNGFVEGTVRLSGRRITKVDRIAFRAPYRQAAHRVAIADFVGDVPLTSTHPSQEVLEDVSGRLSTIEAPVLLAWGARDIVFDDDFAADLTGKFPNSELHRFEAANHLVMVEADVASVVDDWLDDLGRMVDAEERPCTAAATDSLFTAINRRRDDDQTVAIADLAARTSLDFAALARRIDGVAAALRSQGLVTGDRVAMLTPPGIDLLVAVYGVWRAGGVTVVADRGLGLRGLGAAVASTRPSWTIGPKQARAAIATLRWAPRSTHVDVAELMARAEEMSSNDLPPEAAPDQAAAVLFTSGATGPAKGVRYTHGQLSAQRDALAATYSITSIDRLVAAFAPFALYGPALGVPTALTDCNVTTPGELTAAALDEACSEIGATMTFASPAALANVVLTAQRETLPGIAELRLVFSAGAPVPAETLHAVAALAPNASIHTPYGMTEALPVADIDLVGIDAAEALGEAPGVCVGPPVVGAEVVIAPLGFAAADGVPNAVAEGTMGEILVRAPWVSDGYLGRWQIQRQARPGGGWHRSGDVGHLDAQGRLWVEGRSVHVIDTADGPVTPVPVERVVERRLAPAGHATPGRVAAVGVGPKGCQQLVVVLERDDVAEGLADCESTTLVRSAVSGSVAAVLVMHQMPVDIRHNAKIDRVAVAVWASGVLAGETPKRSVAGVFHRLRRRGGS
jgi:acyl-CoA synthetase (AMP-forming)/AMP-acid ligase II/pimeloyl-ACP methyl ester carboxylesterase